MLAGRNAAIDHVERLAAPARRIAALPRCCADGDRRRLSQEPLRLLRRASRAMHVSDAKAWSLDKSRGRYELTVTVDGDADYRVVCAGHLETEADSISDPMMGRVRTDD